MKFLKNYMTYTGDSRAILIFNFYYNFNYQKTAELIKVLQYKWQKVMTYDKWHMTGSIWRSLKLKKQQVI